METTFSLVDPGRTTPYPGDDDAILWAGQLTTARHACCCSALPQVVAVLPPTGRRNQAADLLLCGHHYRAGRAKLAAAHARVYDANGVRVTSGVPGHCVMPGPEADTSC